MRPYRSSHDPRRSTASGYNAGVELQPTCGPGLARRVVSWVVVAAAFLFVVVPSSGCSPGGQSGLEGRVTGLDVFGDVVGYHGAKVIVLDKGSEAQVAVVHSAADGRYRVALEPGDYTVNLYTGLFPKTPSRTVMVEVREGRVTAVPTYQSDNYPRGSEIRNAVLYRIRRIVRAKVERLGLVRDDASFILYSSHAATSEELFGPVGLPADRHVYVVALDGTATASSPPGGKTRAPCHGGYVAKLVTADDFATRATRTSDEPWDGDAGSTLFSGGGGIYSVC